MAEPIAPNVFKKVLEVAGFQCVAEDWSNWVMESGGQPLIIPKKGKFVAEEILEHVLFSAQISDEDFEKFLEQAKQQLAFSARTAVQLVKPSSELPN